VECPDLVLGARLAVATTRRLRLTRGKRPVFFAVLAVAIALSAGPRIASARAAGPTQPQDLAAAITAYATSQIDAAESTAGFSEAVAVQTPAPAPLASPAPTQAADAPQAPGPDPAQVVEPGPVEITAALPSAPAPTIVVPTPTVLAPAGIDPFLRVGTATANDLERLTVRSKSVSPPRGKTVVRSTSSLRVELRTSTSGTVATSSSFASAESRSSVRSSVRSTVKSSASGGRSRTAAAPKAPLPFPPFPPNAPAPPSSGASSTGGGGGNGALLVFSVVLAAFVLAGIHRLLRRVHWSDLRMPGRGAVLPWKPG
jgi:hypothetical protein